MTNSTLAGVFEQQEDPVGPLCACSQSCCFHCGARGPNDCACKCCPPVFQVKGKEAKEGKEKAGATNGHQFVSASPPSAALCVGCDRSVSGKELLQCSSECRPVIAVAVFMSRSGRTCFRVCVKALYTCRLALILQLGKEECC